MCECEWFSLFQYWMSTGTRFIIDWIIFCNHISCAVAIASLCLYVRGTSLFREFICRNVFYAQRTTHTYSFSLFLFSTHNWIVLDAKCNKSSLCSVCVNVFVLCILCSYFIFVDSTFIPFLGPMCGNSLLWDGTFSFVAPNNNMCFAIGISKINSKWTTERS